MGQENLTARELARRILAKEAILNQNARAQYTLAVKLKNGDDVRRELDDMIRQEIVIYMQVSDLALRLAASVIEDAPNDQS
jgi:hypothetical protein